MSRPIQLLDLIGAEKLGEILEGFTAVTGVASIIAGEDGRPITRPYNFTEFCLKYCRSTERGRRRCHKSDRYGGLVSARLQKPHIYSCLNSGLIDFAAPVIVERHHLGTILGGQVLAEPMSREKALRRATAIGVEDTEGYLAQLETIPVMSRERLQKVVNLMSVITRTVSELALQKFLDHRRSQHYLERLVNAASDCIVSTDADSTLMMVNQAGARMFGLHPDDLMGRPLLSLLADEASRETCRARLASGADWRGELTAENAAGSRFPVQASFSRLTDESRETRGFVGVIRDISEEKKIEQMKEDLIAIITHDLRNPVLSLERALKLLVSGSLGPLNENQRKVGELGLLTSRQLYGMVSDLLDLYRKENGGFHIQRAPLDLNLVVAESVAHIQSFAREKRISILFEPRRNPLPLLGDQQRLVRTCNNLLDNAIRYSPEGSSVAVHLMPVSGSRLAGVETLAHHPNFTQSLVEGPCLLFSVTDLGVGIPAEYQPRIFDKFFTIAAREQGERSGVGLGLAFCKQVVEAHAGALWVESPVIRESEAEHQGSRFFILLPGGGAEPAPPGPAPHTP